MFSKVAKEPDFTVPKSYWTTERGVEEGAYDAQKVRERVRMHFRGWQDKDAARSGVMLSMRTHENGDVQVWMRPGAAPRRKPKTGSTAAKKKPTK
jgi:hypothetical protein